MKFTEREKYLQNIFDTGLVSKISKELIKLNCKRTKTKTKHKNNTHKNLKLPYVKTSQGPEQIFLQR